MPASAGDGAPAAGGPCVGIDVGGTFTDVVLFDPKDGRLMVAKVPSTPANQAHGVMTGLRGIEMPLADLGRITHGTTVSTNALLQRDGARVAVVTTAGFRDALEIGRTRRMLPSLYDPAFVRPPPLVSRPLRFEVAERVLPDGSVLEPLDEAAVMRAGKAALAAGAEAFAVCFLHAYANPAHEDRAAGLLRALAPDVPVSTSADVVPEFREYERFSTTALNAYLRPAMDRYLGTLECSLADQGCSQRLLTMSSGGGAMDLDTTCRLPVRTILSGPVGGVLGSLWIAEAVGIRDFVSYDMGGTSTDVCLVEDGRPATVTEIAFAGYPIKGLQVSINTVGAGGGSIAFLEEGGLLKVGPRSAGADPGPACYGQGGTEPTVTDAHVVLNRISGRRPLGGHIDLDLEAARRSVAGLARRIGVGDMAFAEGIIELSIARMASAIREITVERGHNPADFALIAFGGAGPMHATELACELGMRRVVVPAFPGNLSALGLLTADQRHDLVRTYLRRLSALDTGELGAALQALEAEGRAQLATHGFTPAQIRFEHVLDMRYARQAFEISVPLPPGELAASAIKEEFLGCYERHFGHADASAEIEIVNLRTSASGHVPKPAPAAAAARSGRLADALVERRQIVFGRATVECAVYEREALPALVSFAGPAVIEEMGATTVVAPGWTACRDRFGNLHFSADG